MEAIVFHGNERITLSKDVREASDSFTYEFWLRADAEIQLDVESEIGESGILGKRFVVGPVYHNGDDAGIGIALGWNGIAIYEHGLNHMPAVLVYAHDFSTWTHVAVVYRDRCPFLYINGTLVKQGLTSSRRHVYPSADLGGHEYGNFIGQMKEFRLWKTARTENEIGWMMHHEISSNESDLLWYWNQPSRKLIWNGTQMNIHISVIIASHNRFPLNWFALQAIEMQTFPHDHMEVVFVADGLPDSGIDYANLVHPTFPFKFIQCQSTAGRSAARNIGMQAAMGEILLFIDAEMICPPDFVQGHVLHHIAQSQAVVSGAMEMRRVFTVMAPGFNSDQISNAYEVYKGNSEALRALDQFFTGDGSTIHILPMASVMDTDFLSQHCYSDAYFGEILNEFGPCFEGFHFPWMNFITNNVSVPRDLIETVGGFDEQFKGFGWEDWDLGYRLYLHGAKFIHDSRLVTYHQDHPILSENLSQSRENFRRFQRKYPSIDLRVFVLDMIPHRVPFHELNQIVEEYEDLCMQYPGDYLMIKQGVHTLLEHVTDLFAEGKPISGIAQSVNLSREHMSQLEAELSDSRLTLEYPHLERIVRFLLAL